MIIFTSRSTLQLTWKVSKKAPLRLDGKRVKVLTYDEKLLRVTFSCNAITFIMDAPIFILFTSTSKIAHILKKIQDFNGV